MLVLDGWKKSVCLIYCLSSNISCWPAVWQNCTCVLPNMSVDVLWFKGTKELELISLLSVPVWKEKPQTYVHLKLFLRVENPIAHVFFKLIYALYSLFALCKIFFGVPFCRQGEKEGWNFKVGEWTSRGKSVKYILLWSLSGFRFCIQFDGILSAYLSLCL